MSSAVVINAVSGTICLVNINRADYESFSLIETYAKLHKNTSEYPTPSWWQ